MSTMIKIIGRVIIYGLYFIYCIWSGAHMGSYIATTQPGIIMDILLVGGIALFNGVIGYILAYTIES